MKKSIIFPVISIMLLLSGCVTEKYSLSSTLIDFSSYFEKGMFMTSGEFNSKYAPIGIVEVVCYEGYKLKNGTKEPEADKIQKSRDDLYYSSNTQPSGNLKDYKFTGCWLDDLLNEMYIKAKDKNANGIIKIEIQNISRPSSLSKAIIPGVRIVGMAIINTNIKLKWTVPQEKRAGR